MAGPNVRTRRWTRIEYDRLIDAGFFRPGDPVELLGGQMIVAEPQGSRHFAALRAAQEALRQAFGDGWEIRGRGPLALDDESEPEPDLAVVPGTFRDYRLAHPTSPSLVVEISETSLALDRAHKGSLYARAGLVDYWIREPARASTRGLPEPRAQRDRPVRLAIQLDHRSGAGPAAGRLRGAAGSTRSAHPDLRSLLELCALVGEEVREVDQVLVGDKGSAPAAAPLVESPP